MASPTFPLKISFALVVLLSFAILSTFAAVATRPLTLSSSDLKSNPAHPAHILDHPQQPDLNLPTVTNANLQPKGEFWKPRQVATDNSIPTRKLRSFDLKKDGPDCSPSSRVDKEWDIDGKEQAWAKQRRTIVEPALAKFLQVPQSDLSGLKELPHLGFAFSGGGWRAFLTDLGHVVGASRPNPNVTGVEHLWSATTYMAGISGGSWFLSSFADLAESPSEFIKDVYIRLSMSVLDVPGGPETWYTIAKDVYIKREDPNVPESIIDFYGPLISSHFLTWDPPRPLHPVFGVTPVGLEERFSGKIADNVRNMTNSLPFPIITCIRVDDYKPVPDYPDFFEFTPFQTGSITPGVEAYIPTECLNTQFDGGIIPNGVQPYSGDSTPFIMGTSGSGPFALDIGTALLLGCESICGLGCHGLCAWLKAELSNASSSYDRFWPSRLNNFLRGTGVPGELNTLDEVVLVDAGIMLNIPFLPLVNRGVRYLFAVDSSMSAIGGKPRGHSLVAFADYAHKKGIPFPDIPTEFANVTDDYTLPKKLQGRPLIFGANNADPSFPTIIYLPLMNDSSLTPDWPAFDPFFVDTKTSFSVKEIDAMIELNAGLMQRKELIESVRCIMLKDLKLPTNGCKCEICWPFSDQVSGSHVASDETYPLV